MWSKRNASALVRPCHADAQSASLRENRLSRHLQHFPARPSVPGLPHAEGRAPHARTDDSRFTEAWPRSATGPSFAPDDYVTPRLASGLAMRTRRPRPSEKTASRANPGSSSARPSHPRLAPPAEGRAPHARYETITLAPTLPPFGNWPLAHFSVTVTHPGLHPAFHLACSGTHPPKNRLPEKLPPRHASSHCP